MGRRGLESRWSSLELSFSHAGPKEASCFSLLLTFCPTLTIRQRQQTICVICGKERVVFIRDKA